MQTKPKLRFKDKNGNAYPEWRIITLGDIFNISAGGDIKKNNCTKEKTDLNIYPVYANALTNDGLYGYTNSYKVKSPAITITGRGDVGHAVSRKEPFYPIVRLLVLQPNTELNTDFYTSAINRTKIFIESTGVPQLTSPQVAKVKLFAPCLEEQEKIAGFLSKVDELINECEGEVKDLEEQKKGLMQKIFSQQIRFKDSNNNPYPDWEEKVMNDILNEYCKKNSISNQYPVLTSSKQGLMLQTEYYSGENRITEKDNIGFNIIPPNYITYRSRSDDGLFTFNINNLGVTGIVSTYYPVFSTNYNNLFVITYLNINKNNLFKYAVGSSQKVLSLNELKKVKIKLPCQEEQEKITKVLSKMDELIEEKKELLSDWQQFKKGLLQQMFV